MGGGFICCYRRQEDLVQSFAFSKWAYCICFTITSIITWLMRDYADQWFLDHSGAFSYCSESQYASLCSGKQVAVRISFANFVFFAAHFVLLLCCVHEDDVRAPLHTSLWFWKLLAWAGTIVGFFFVPSSAMVIYAQIARFGAGVFLVFVMIEMVTWIYDINDWLISKDSRASWTVIIGGTVVCFLAGMVMVGLAYYYYAPSGGCSLNIFFATWSIIIAGVMVLILFVPGRLESAGLLTSAAVFCYAAYLLISALSSEPPNECVKLEGVGNKWIQVVGFFLGIFAVCYSTLCVGTSDIFNGETEKLSALPYRPDFFHLMFAFASMYMCMLFTNWEVSSNTSQFELSTGWISTWVKMGSKWFCELLYCWTVLAPRIFPNRDFSRR